MTHSSVSLYDLVEAVKGKVAGISGAVATANATMREGIADKRTIQVYPSAFEGATAGSRNDRNTFGAGLQLRRYTVKIDVYSRPRSQLGEDIEAATKDAYSVIGILEAQDSSPAFGLSGVHTFHWTGTLGILPYGGVEYWGSQFTLTFLCH